MISSLQMNGFNSRVQQAQQGMNSMGAMPMNQMGPRIPSGSNSAPMMNTQMVRPSGPNINMSK